MKVKIHLEHGWTWVGKVAVRGMAFDSKGSILSGQQLAERFRSGDVENILRSTNGFFSVVISEDNKIFAAVDRVRSMPLFYAANGSEFLVSDNARWIHRQLPHVEIDLYSAAEFLMTGYATGALTLIRGLKQLQAGEYLVLDLNSGRMELKPYFQLFSPSKDDTADEESMMEVLDTLTVQSIERLATVANGRTIVIPLSGGLDSRLIAMQLRRLGYRDVIAFTYGVPGNAEATVSKTVADQLGMAWEFVPYDHGLWRQWYTSREYTEYVRMADGLCSVAHIQDWPAVWVLSQKGRIPQNAVFVPGHSGDFLAGSHISYELLGVKTATGEQVIQAVWNHHYVLNNAKRVANFLNLPYGDIVTNVRDRILSSTNFSGGSVDEAVSAYENWDWRERQAKFIVNSVRVYEYWGYRWWLPLWDGELMAFWRAVPNRYRINKSLYRKYVGRVQDEVHVKIGPSKRERVRDMVYRLGLAKAAWRIRRLLREVEVVREYENHPMAWYGIVDRFEFRKLIDGKASINTILAINQLETLVQEIKLPAHAI